MGGPRGRGQSNLGQAYLPGAPAVAYWWRLGSRQQQTTIGDKFQCGLRTNRL